MRNIGSYSNHILKYLRLSAWYWLKYSQLTLQNKSWHHILDRLIFKIPVYMYIFIYIYCTPSQPWCSLNITTLVVVPTLRSRLAWPYSYFKWKILTFMRWNWKCHFIIVIKTGLSGFAVTMQSGLYEKVVKSIGLIVAGFDSCSAAPSCIVTTKPLENRS